MDFHWPPPPHDRWRRLWPPWPKPPWPASWWSSSWAASQARGAMGPQRLQVSKSRFTGRVDLWWWWWWWLLMTGFWVHLNAQLTDPREPTAHAGKTPGTFGGCGSRDSGTAKTDTRCEGSTQRATQTDQDTNKYGEGGLGYSCVVSAAFVIDGYRRARSALCCGWLFLLGGFSVSGCFVSAAHFSHFSWHELPASTKLCIVLTDAEISPTEHTTSQVATSYEYFSYT